MKNTSKLVNILIILVLTVILLFGISFYKTFFSDSSNATEKDATKTYSEEEYNKIYSELTEAKLDLENAQADLEKSESERRDIKSDLEEVQSELEDSKSDLKEAKSKLKKNKSDLEKSEQKDSSNDLLSLLFFEDGNIYFMSDENFKFYYDIDCRNEVTEPLTFRSNQRHDVQLPNGRHSFLALSFEKGPVWSTTDPSLSIKQ